MTRSDYFVSELCDFLQTYTVLILSMAGSCGAVFLFYRNKLKMPMEELAQASQKIAGNHLDFHIAYENQDEMGVLCKEFERMREALARNNLELWRRIEDEQELRAAIAHDVRSPLAVLKGYLEMLITYLPDGTIAPKKAMEMLEESRKQTERMDLFVETMGRISSLEQRELKIAPITARGLGTALEPELRVLEQREGKRIFLKLSEADVIFEGDQEVILEVAENLLSNGLRYAREQVHIEIRVTRECLKLLVRDDGEGFLEEAEKVTLAFYQKNARDSLKHAGMGMYISRLYCERHGGCLLLENEDQGGALVTAVFGSVGK